MNAASDKITFAVVSDLQYAPLPPVKNRYFAKAGDKLREVISATNRQQTDFLINLGDTIDCGFENFREILPLFRNANMPVYHVLGNHDYEVEDKLKSEVPNALGIANYYHFSIRRWRFIVLDGNEISTFANLPGSPNHRAAEKLLQDMEKNQCINANFWNGGISELQLQWLEATLQDAARQEESAVIFCHYPLFPPDRHNLLNAAEVMKMIMKYPCVKAWFCGHNHHGNYGMHSDIHFINMKGMVEGEFDIPWSIVSLDDRCISIEGFGNEISAELVLRKNNQTKK
ncbi:MAG: metallophosphoesterase [Cyclobacteriaceae bacterium]|nr:metallophosphoesterase [Cyclobacteriaceae bacterium]